MVIMEWAGDVTIDIRAPTTHDLGEISVLKWICQLASGLKGLHDQGVFHGDIRPGKVRRR